MMQVSKKIPFEDPQVLLAVRTVYVISNILILAVYFYIQQKINRKKGQFHPPLPPTTSYTPTPTTSTILTR